MVIRPPKGATTIPTTQFEFQNWLTSAVPSLLGRVPYRFQPGLFPVDRESSSSDSILPTTKVAGPFRSRGRGRPRQPDSPCRRFFTGPSAKQLSHNVLLCHSYPRYNGLSGIPACQAFPKSVFFRCSDRSLPRSSCPQGSLGAPRVSGWCRIGPFPVIMPYPDTVIPITGISVAGSRGRPPLKRLSATTTPVTRAQSHGRVAERTYNGPLPRPPPLQGPQWNPRVSGLPEIGLFPVLRPVSATAPLPTVVSEAWSRVSAVNYRPSATSTPVTGICEASPRVRPS